jgi:hypothetical protein
MTTCEIRHVAFGDKGDNAESRLAVTQFLVKATSNEWQMLWEQFCSQSTTCRDPLINKWEQLGGWLATVGSLRNRPVCISLHWCRLDGFLVCQWDATSELVDFKIIREWLGRHFSTKTIDQRPATCDAANFHHCLHEIEAWKELK